MHTNYCNIFVTDNNRTTSNNTTSSRGDNSEEMCSTLKKWGKSYTESHGYIAIAVCVFGILANFLNMLVFTRKEMSVSPINKILTGKITNDNHL